MEHEDGLGVQSPSGFGSLLRGFEFANGKGLGLGWQVFLLCFRVCPVSVTDRDRQTDRQTDRQDCQFIGNLVLALLVLLRCVFGCGFALSPSF